MIFFIDEELSFPPVELANKDGLLCVGGDLSAERLLLAYSSGIFPWSDDPILWFSPAERMIIDLNSWKPSKSLARKFKQKIFTLKIDTCFEDVMKNCALTRDSTWISSYFIESYGQLYQMGLAHSFEIFADDKLVGGLYGLSLGSAFFGESMFHKMTDASKVAFAHLIYFLRHNKFTLLDCQVNNSHLASLGGIDIPRDEYLESLRKALQNKRKAESWRDKLSNYLESL